MKPVVEPVRRYEGSRWARRLRELEVEIAHMKKLLAEAGSDKAMPKELAEGER